MNEILSEIHLKQLEDHYATGKPYWMPFGTREDGMSDSGAEWIKEALTLREENRALHAQLAAIDHRWTRKDIDELEREKAAAQQQYQDLLVKMGKSLTEREREILGENSALKQRVKELEAELPSTFYADRDGAERVKRLIESWRKAITSNQFLENRYEIALKENDELTKENSGFRGCVTDLQAKVKDYAVECQDLLAKVDSRDEEIVGKNSALAYWSVENQQLQAKLAQVERRNDENATEYERWYHEALALQAKLAAVEAELDNKRTHTVLADGEIERLQQRITALSNAVVKFLNDVESIPPWQSAGMIWAQRIKELHAIWLDQRGDNAEPTETKAAS